MLKVSGSRAQETGFGGLGFTGLGFREFRVFGFRAYLCFGQMIAQQACSSVAKPARMNKTRSLNS